MALPLIYAAGAIVARFIVKKGLTAAAKKFTKKAIVQGKKHADDLLKKNGGETVKKAANIKKIKPVQNMNANSRATLRKGVTIGAGTTAVAAAAKLKKQKIAAAAKLKEQKIAAKLKEKQLREKLKEQTSATARAKVQTQVEKMVAKIVALDLAASKTK